VQIDQINLNQIRIFESVFRLKSMTAAAHELNLTQSGVSQHMKTLEDMLDIVLFDRIKQKLIPTSAAVFLYERVSKSLGYLEEGLNSLKLGQKELLGKVAIGMPIEFGSNLIIPQVAQFCEKNLGVDVLFRVGFATEMNTRILEGELDFAFVDKFTLDSRIQSEVVFKENLQLCVSKEYLKRIAVKNAKIQDKEFFEKLTYIAYQAGAPVLRLWFEKNFGKKIPRLNVKSTLMDVQGIGRMIAGGMGCGVLPEYFLQKLKNEGVELIRLKGTGRIVLNEISVARLKNKTLTLASRSLMEFLLDGLKKVKK